VDIQIMKSFWLAKQLAVYYTSVHLGICYWIHIMALVTTAKIPFRSRLREDYFCIKNDNLSFRRMQWNAFEWHNFLARFDCLYLASANVLVLGNVSHGQEIQHARSNKNCIDNYNWKIVGETERDLGIAGTIILKLELYSSAWG
jgi:hypothetical protein